MVWLGGSSSRDFESKYLGKVRLPVISGCTWIAYISDVWEFCSCSKYLFTCFKFLEESFALSFSSNNNWKCQENYGDGPICKCFELLQWKGLRKNKIKVKDKKVKATEKGTAKLKTPEAFPKKTKAPQSWV